MIKSDTQRDRTIVQIEGFRQALAKVEGPLAKVEGPLEEAQALAARGRSCNGSRWSATP